MSQLTDTQMRVLRAVALQGNYYEILNRYFRGDMDPDQLRETLNSLIDCNLIEYSGETVISNFFQYQLTDDGQAVVEDAEKNIVTKLLKN